MINIKDINVKYVGRQALLQLRLEMQTNILQQKEILEKVLKD